MKQYLAAFTIHEENGQNYWTRIGAAFPTKNGGFSIVLNALPASQEGQFRIVLQVPKAPEEQAKGQRRPARN
ncbi:MAG TPA: hypothetical protein VGL56_20940 [Fimbriimonadaceae bacterium]